MTETIKKVVLQEQVAQSEGQFIGDNYLGLLGDVEIECTVRVGTINLTIGALKVLQCGQILSLEQKTNEPIELLVNDKVIARGELVSCDEYFALQITEVLSS